MTNSKLERRRFLKLSAVVVASPILQSGCGGETLPEERVLFSQSVASGDPRPDSIILWTRASDPSTAGAPVTLRLEVSRTAAFDKLLVRAEGLLAQATDDFTVKVKVLGLSPRTTYHYRFVTTRDGNEVRSPVGRTRTAPDANDAATVRIAFASCQDSVGRYYNVWQQLLDRDEDLDVILFLGDYIYETTEAPGFMAPGSGTRNVRFTDLAGALALGTASSPYYAARSLANYRELYRAYRSDPFLQRVHERYPFIVVWDDHEFSNDAWGAHATYSDGARIELDLERRQNAERAFFEHLPIDPPSAPSPPGAQAVQLAPLQAPLYPATRIWRDFAFGAHLQVAVVDTRTHRPDHLIPEDAYPGAVVLDAQLLAQLAATGRLSAEAQALLASNTFAYVNIDEPEFAAYKAALVAAAMQEAAGVGLDQVASMQKAEAAVKGNLAVPYINAVAEKVNAAAPAGTTPLPPLAGDDELRGLAYLHLGKRQFFSSLGSRYIVAADTFELYAAYVFASSNGSSEDVLGQAQEQWLSSLLSSAGTRWTLVGSSVSMTQILLDLRMLPIIPEPQRARLLFSADQWDGFPNKKRQLLAQMAASGGGRAVCLAGDIHASFASLERSSPTSAGVPCLTAPAISSATASELAGGAVTGAGLDPTNPGVALLVANIDGLFQQANPGIALADSKHHGLVVLEVKADEILARYHLVPATEVGSSYAGRKDELAKLAVTRTVRVTPGALQLLP